MTDILLVEDNEELSRLMTGFLKKEQYSISVASSGEEALNYISKNEVRLVLLDIMLPGIDGFTVCYEIRNNGNIPIVILSARTDKEDKINGFSIGADDYIEKPVDIDILLAKISAIFKRYYSAEQDNSIIKSGNILINQDKMSVMCNNVLLTLTIKEYELLLMLVKNKGKTLNKNYLFNEIWGAYSESENQTLTVHIKMLRDKIEEDSKNPKHIKTVWGVGYRYDEI